MSTREKLHNAIDMLTDEQIDAIYSIFCNFGYEPNEESLEAMRETEDMRAHPEKYRSYNDIDEMFEEILENEVLNIAICGVQTGFEKA